MNELKHLAIIMDGNGRWAKNSGFIRTRGHEVGANVTEDIAKYCISNNINHLTLYAFSTENWKRPKSEVDFLMNLLAKFIKNKEENFLKKGIKFNTIGDLTPLNKYIKTKIANLKEITKNNTKLNFNLAINYGGRDEIVRACKNITEKNLNITEDSISAHLDSNEFGDVDLMIRTGGEHRLSNFMLWSASYAELAFTDTLWPDFNAVELDIIVKNYQNIQRRFGGL